MSEPIRSVDFSSIEFPAGGPSADLQRQTRHHADSVADSAAVTPSKGKAGRSVREYAGALQTRFQEVGSSVQVGVDTVNGNIVFTIRDEETGQVIRKIPSDEAIRIAKNIDRLSGLYVDKLE